MSPRANLVEGPPNVALKAKRSSPGARPTLSAKSCRTRCPERRFLFLPLREKAELLLTGEYRLSNAMPIARPQSAMSATWNAINASSSLLLP
jgi:hypothetical protein